jgi:hypothetical protein
VECRPGLGARAGMLLAGDEPFIIGQDSSDTWANPAT